jgi:hypothetical protein
VFAIFFQGGTGFQPVSVLFDRQDACPTAIKIPERGFGAKRMSLRWEVRDGEERCQFRKADCDEDGRIRGHGVRTSLTLLAGAGGDKLPDIFK